MMARPQASNTPNIINRSDDAHPDAVVALYSCVRLMEARDMGGTINHIF